MLGRYVNLKAVQTENFTALFEKTAGVLTKADISFINLEGPLGQGCPLTSAGMIFCADTRHSEGLVFAGIDVANLANNHTGDQGQAGIVTTTRVLAQNHIALVGTDRAVTKNVRGIRFAFLGYNMVSPQTDGIAWAKDELIKNDIGEVRTHADVVVVQFHWGDEYTSQPGTRQRELARLTVDAGADLVVGNHPHWIQPIEIYKNKVIAYSHGNFIFDQNWSQKTSEGVVGKYTFYDTQLVDVEFLPVFIESWGQPYFLDGKGKQRILDEMKQESVTLSQIVN